MNEWLLLTGVIAACVAALASLLLLARRPADPGEALQRLRLLGEQTVAGQQGGTETIRALLAETERGLAGRLGTLRSEFEQRVGDLTTRMAREAGDGRVLLEAKLREMAEQNATRLADIQKSVNEQLHAAVEKQMTTSFQRVIEQFGAVQKAMGDVAAVTSQIGDLKRIFSNVKSRGGWGETQLRALLDDALPAGGYAANVRLSEESAEVVEFAVRMPARGEAARLLAIDAKFPTEDYERLVNAAEIGDGEAERAARRALETRFREEARKISGKYIVPPKTVDFAVMYLPTDGLYAEAARLPGLIDELGRQHRVMVMGPALLPAMLRTINLGYITLALEEKSEQIGRLLGATKSEMLKMDGVLEKLAKNAGTMSRTIEDARQRTRVVGRKLKSMEAPTEEMTEGLLQLGTVEIAEEDEAAE